MSLQEGFKKYRAKLSKKKYKEALQQIKSIWSQFKPTAETEDNLVENFNLIVSQLRLALHYNETELFETIYCELVASSQLEIEQINLLHFLRLEHLLISGLLEKAIDQQTHLRTDLLRPKDQERLLQLKSYIQSRSESMHPLNANSEASKDSESETSHKINQLLRNGNYKEALPILEELSQADPTNVTYLYNLAITKLELSHYKDAIGLFKSCLVIDPLHQKSAFNIAQMAKGLGDEAGYLEYLRLCFQINPFSRESGSISPEVGIGVH